MEIFSSFIRTVLELSFTLAPIVTAGGVLLVWRQLAVAKQTLSDDHKRSRLQFAIELAREWNRSVRPETSAAQRLIQALNLEQCKKIANYESPVKITKNYEHLVQACLPLPPGGKGDDKELSLDPAAVKQLRYLGVDCLNELELVLSAWQNHVADQKYIEKEFSFVDNKTTMVHFREALGSERYPAIAAFLTREGTRSSPPLGK